MGQVLVLSRGLLDRGLEQSQRRSVYRVFVEVVGWVEVGAAAVVVAVVASVLVVCSENHPRATPGGGRRRSL